MWNLVEPKLVTVKPLCGNLRKLNFWQWNLYVEPCGTWTFDSGTFIHHRLERWARHQACCADVQVRIHWREGRDSSTQRAPKIQTQRNYGHSVQEVHAEGKPAAKKPPSMKSPQRERAKKPRGNIAGVPTVPQVPEKGVVHGPSNGIAERWKETDLPAAAAQSQERPNEAIVTIVKLLDGSETKSHHSKGCHKPIEPPKRRLLENFRKASPRKVNEEDPQSQNTFTKP